ncbi:unnamed protein product [Didymodactylos carnosus]|uniref:Calponin-homology (CH) domain-containing protein n=1 Tax=Didymodactylos carnosus TaxID=1234261 RepID=A0A813W1J5_9BILA|nr:unnamed protein product [Didymodactylos carnosus]CAF0851346.1 unnamed protein product [Didymodactylos carnosus]CAF3496003.1 unnamed protein product [Didymodactylos carnosus]CAF3638980.1 unnamed protein product [Didymodactylos carnosus]
MLIDWKYRFDDGQRIALFQWIDRLPFSRTKTRIERDFSDGLMVAELIKYYFPSWVDLHNYAPANSTQQKLINWGLLNRKILCRFNLNVPEPVMRGICLGRSGLVEVFLYNLRTKIDEVLHQKAKTSEHANAMITPRQNYTPPEMDEQSQNISQYVRSGPQRLKPQGPGRKTTSMHNLSGDVVSRIEFDEKEQECMAKDEQIQILQAKIRRLEHLLHLKDIRVEDLSEKLERIKGASIGNRQPPSMINGRK